MTTLITKIQRLKKRTEEKFEHPFLNRYIGKQEICEDKLAFLISVMSKDNSLSNEKSDIRIITALLVQTALDTHELVPTNNNEVNNESAQIEKQLRVLAGDYYSGLYYYLLSQIDDYKFINILATAIKEINEHKMQLLDYDYPSFEQFMNLKIKIDSSLIDQISDYMSNPILKPLLKEWLYINFLYSLKQKNNEHTARAITILEQSANESAVPFDEKWIRLMYTHKSTFKQELEKLPESYKEMKDYFIHKSNHMLCFHTKVAGEG